VVEPQNHTTTIFMSLASKSDSAVPKGIKGDMWSHHESKGASRQTKFMKKVWLGKLYVSMVVYECEKRTSVNKEEGMHQLTISLTCGFCSLFSYVTRP
jgi:hypothetical protein